jgi:hypothetical protein
MRVEIDSGVVWSASGGEQRRFARRRVIPPLS